MISSTPWDYAPHDLNAEKLVLAYLVDTGERMDDAMATRDACDNRTDKRVTYNGLLQMLRRELRAAERVSSSLYPAVEEDLE